MAEKSSIRFHAETEYAKARERKANTNLPVMAVVGNHTTGVAPVPNRPAWYYIRLINERDRVTQCKAEGVALVLGDYIYVVKARDRNLTYYEFHSFIQSAGGLPVPPTCPRWEQVFTVSVNSCQYRLVSDAVAAIAALAALPAPITPSATSPWLIQVMAGDYDENNAAVPAAVLIPQYVHLVGRGESTIIDMDTFELDFDDNTGGERFVVISTGVTSGCVVDVHSNVVLRDVRILATGANARCVNVVSEDNLAAYHVVCEASGGATHVGFYFDDSTGNLLWDCEADDAANFDIGLHVSAATAVSTVTTKFCEFGADAKSDTDGDVVVATGSTWNHFCCQFDPDDSTIAAGTHHALPTKRFNQEVIVAEEGGDFQELSEAITWINAQADAAAGKLYGIKMLAGNYNEGANVTISQHIHVMGEGKGTMLDMGNFQLEQAVDTSLESLDITGTGTDTGFVVYVNGNNAIQRELNVTVTGSANVAIYIDSCTGYEAYHVACETTQNLAYGFYFDNSTGMLWDCRVDDTDHWDDGLFLDNNLGPSTVTTLFCQFRVRALGDDVHVVLGSTWNYIACNFDLLNCTIAGTENFLPQRLAFVQNAAPNNPWVGMIWVDTT